MSTEPYIYISEVNDDENALEYDVGIGGDFGGDMPDGDSFEDIDDARIFAEELRLDVGDLPIIED